MPETKRSPAPWVAKRSFNTLWIWAANNEIVCFSHDEIEPGGDPVKKELNTVNMALVAAAPELLAKLKEMYHLLKGIDKDLHYQPMTDEEGSLRLLYEKAGGGDIEKG